MAATGVLSVRVHERARPAHVETMTIDCTTTRTPLTVDDLSEGDVLSWAPASRHAHEGTAVVRRRDDGTLYAVDTFWGFGENHVLRADELAGATIEWNKTLFRQADGRTETWSDFAPEDRRMITSQHSLQATYWLRPGAKPDHATKVAKAEEALRRAEDDLRSAQNHVEWRRRDLIKLNTEATA